MQRYSVWRFTLCSLEYSVNVIIHLMTFTGCSREQSCIDLKKKRKLHRLFLTHHPQMFTQITFLLWSNCTNFPHKGRFMGEIRENKQLLSFFIFCFPHENRGGGLCWNRVKLYKHTVTLRSDTWSHTHMVTSPPRLKWNPSVCGSGFNRPQTANHIALVCCARSGHAFTISATLGSLHTYTHCCYRPKCSLLLTLKPNMNSCSENTGS